MDDRAQHADALRAERHGGGFGGKGMVWSPTILAAAAARLTNAARTHAHPGRLDAEHLGERGASQRQALRRVVEVELVVAGPRRDRRVQLDRILVVAKRPVKLEVSREGVFRTVGGRTCSEQRVARRAIRRVDVKLGRGQGRLGIAHGHLGGLARDVGGRVRGGLVRVEARRRLRGRVLDPDEGGCGIRLRLRLRHDHGDRLTVPRDVVGLHHGQRARRHAGRVRVRHHDHDARRGRGIEGVEPRDAPLRDRAVDHCRVREIRNRLVPHEARGPRDLRGAVHAA